MYKRVTVSVDGHDVETAYLDEGDGPVVLLLHGSGPGVSAQANWSRTVPALSEHFRVIAPDLLGFGETVRPEGLSYIGPTWAGHVLGFLDTLGVQQCSVVGNSFGGSLSLRLSLLHPNRVERQVLMGPGGLKFTATAALERAWAYQGRTESDMWDLLASFLHNPGLLTPEVVKARHQAAMRPGVLEEYAQMFPAPGQRLIDAGALSPSELRSINQETLIVHGRDDKIVPMSVGVDLVNMVPNAQLHIFGKCGHWVQIEAADRFNRLVLDFLKY